MILSRSVAAIFMLLATTALGCTYNKTVDEAIQKYQARNYSEALAELETVEGNESQLNERWHMRYLVFRGLAHFRAFRKNGSTSDRDAARRFLSSGRRRYEHGNRAYLSVEEERELNLAVEALKEEAAGEPIAR